MSDMSYEYGYIGLVYGLQSTSYLKNPSKGPVAEICFLFPIGVANASVTLS